MGPEGPLVSGQIWTKMEGPVAGTSAYSSNDFNVLALTTAKPFAVCHSTNFLVCALIGHPDEIAIWP